MKNRSPIFFTLLATLFAAALAASMAPASAQAQSATPEGFYIGGAGGAGWLNDSDIDGTNINTEADFDTGWAGLGALGYSFGNNWRGELELGFRSNDLDSVSNTSGQGDVEAFNFMGNVLYDFKNSTRFTPYLGVGLGGLRVDADGYSPVGNSRVDDDDTSFAYQAIAGVSYDIDEALKLTADYRYLSAPDLEFKTDSGVNVDSEYRSHAIMVGLRYSFGAPAKPAPAPVKVAEPAPAPAPEPEVPNNYLVFFDWDKSEITAESSKIIDSAAETYRKFGLVRITLTGHADRSGTEAYNMRLSMRRAKAVQDELKRRGIPEDRMTLVAKGETDPLVSTPDGVREAQNRRVEIVLSK